VPDRGAARGHKRTAAAGEREEVLGRQGAPQGRPGALLEVGQAGRRGPLACHAAAYGVNERPDHESPSLLACKENGVEMGDASTEGAHGFPRRALCSHTRQEPLRTAIILEKRQLIEYP
jgi:hypothetical protein